MSPSTDGSRIEDLGLVMPVSFESHVYTCLSLPMKGYGYQILLTNICLA